MTSSSDIPQPRSFLRNLIPVLLFLLLCGIVGPIFLVMGLSVGDEPGAGWMLPTGIGITALDVVIAVAIANRRTERQRRMYRLRTQGRRAEGRVLSFEQTNMRVNDQPMLVIRLRIEGEGITPFEAQVRSVVPDIQIPLLHAGTLPVLIDPETDEWEIDWDSARVITPSVAAAGITLTPPTDERPAADRLAELDDLLRRDLVSRDEYDAARARILDEL